jgi:hypothetical protein
MPWTDSAGSSINNNDNNKIKCKVQKLLRKHELHELNIIQLIIHREAAKCSYKVNFNSKPNSPNPIET